VLAGSRVLLGVIKDEAYCQACSDAKRHAWTDVYLEPVRKVLFFAVGDFLALHFLTPARQKRVFSLF
jgi:hypothetical protein